MPLHVFDAAIALQPLANGVYAGNTHPAWANMVGPFGGITAATLLQAAVVDPRRIGDPAALTVNFAGPVADGPFTIEAVPVRTSRTTQHWTLFLKQQDQVATLATALFAVRRDTWGSADLEMPQVPAFETLPAGPRPPLQWINNYDLRFVSGGFSESLRKLAAGGHGVEAAPPVPEHPDSLSQVWVRDADPRPLDLLSLAAICDVFYPRIYRRRPKVVPAGTVSMTSYFHASAAELAAQGTRAVLGCARAGRFTQGFFDQSAEIWSDAGVLLARSQQTVYYKE